MIGTKLYKNNPVDMTNYTNIAIWCNTNNAVIVDKDEYYEVVTIVIPLADVKASKIAELKSARDKAEQAPVQTEKGFFDVDDKSITRISNTILVLEKTGLTLEWTLADNTVVEVTSIDLQNVIINLAKQSNEVHEKYRMLKECVEKAATAEDVNAIVWDDVEPVEEVLPEQ